MADQDKPKRTMSPEHKAKLEEGRRRAVEEKRNKIADIQNNPVVRADAEAPPLPRKQRKNFSGGRLRLSARMVPGYHLCWMNDDGMVEEALESGYNFVHSSSESNDVGTKERRLVGKKEDGSPLYAYLMKIEQELWEADQKEIQDRCNRTDAAIRRGPEVEKGYGADRIKLEVNAT